MVAKPFFAFALVSMAALAALASAARADIYMLRDSRGIVYFTDTLPSGGADYEVIKSYTPPSATGHAESPFKPAPASYNTRYDHLIRAAASRHGLDPVLVKAVIKVESDFDRFSISSKGARGLMQLMPDTARLLNVYNVFDPERNIDGGTRYLRMMLDEFGGNTRLALAAYNAGPTAVKRYGGVPPYGETIRYIQKVRQAYTVFSGGFGPSSVSTTDSTSPGAAKPAVYVFTPSDGRVAYTDLPIGRSLPLD